MYKKNIINNLKWIKYMKEVSQLLFIFFTIIQFVFKNKNCIYVSHLFHGVNYCKGTIELLCYKPISTIEIGDLTIQ